MEDNISKRLSEIFQGDIQETVALKLNTTQGNVSKWVNGQQLPTIDMLREISIAYKVSTDWILGLSDQKEIDGLVIEKLSYEQAVRIIDRLIEMGTLIIPNLQELIEGRSEIEECMEDEEILQTRVSAIDSDYLKVNDRIFSYMLRRRLKIYEIGEDFVEIWKTQSLPLFRGLKLLNYKGNMEEAIDTRPWAAFNKDGDWVELIKELGSMSEEQRAVLIAKKKSAKDGKKDG